MTSQLIAMRLGKRMGKYAERSQKIGLCNMYVTTNFSFLVHEIIVFLRRGGRRKLNNERSIRTGKPPSSCRFQEGSETTRQQR